MTTLAPGGATIGEEAAGVTPPSPGGPGVRLGEGLGVRAYAPRINAISRRVCSIISAAPAP